MIDPYAAARLIANRGDLKRKAVNFRRGQDVRLTSELRGKIEKVIVENQADFETAALGMLGDLKDAWNSAAFNSIGRARYYEWIHDLALELKGQGSLFGYPLVTLYADTLRNLTASLTQPSSRLHAIIGLNIDALGIIIRRRITGPGSTLERRVAEALREAYVKMRLRTPAAANAEQKVAAAVRQLDGKRSVEAPELKGTARQWPGGVRLPAS
ncbi:MAG TPA: hypothetical protein VF194_01940 [Ferrovibrio sp.]|uniref:hypothetical protein n=1 Tax=Ferrovibrio sp. TaxID=1917215 RepID=UPI002ED6448D